MNSLKRAALASLALAAIAGAAPASAQYDGGRGYLGGPRYRDPIYDPNYPQPDPRFYRHRRHRYDDDQSDAQPGGEIGYTCWTRRGSCDLSDGREIGTVCRCYIPGFGRKRGYVNP